MRGIVRRAPAALLAVGVVAALAACPRLCAEAAAAVSKHACHHEVPADAAIPAMSCCTLAVLPGPDAAVAGATAHAKHIALVATVPAAHHAERSRPLEPAPRAEAARSARIYIRLARLLL